MLHGDQRMQVTAHAAKCKSVKPDSWRQEAWSYCREHGTCWVSPRSATVVPLTCAQRATLPKPSDRVTARSWLMSLAVTLHGHSRQACVSMAKCSDGPFCDPFFARDCMR